VRAQGEASPFLFNIYLMEQGVWDDKHRLQHVAPEWENNYAKFLVEKAAWVDPAFMKQKCAQNQKSAVKSISRLCRNRNCWNYSEKTCLSTFYEIAVNVLRRTLIFIRKNL
jgi:hypothetical protein